MSLFQCENCGCVENTALSFQGFKDISNWFSWTGIEDRKGKMLCSACGPKITLKGQKTGYGEWHGKFKRIFLPIGEFFTNKDGNLQHKETGSTDLEQYIKG